MDKMQKIERTIKQAKSVDELVEQLFWLDCYIVDDGQWILDTNEGKIYSHTSHYFTSIIDLMGEDYFSLYHETDQDLIDELDTF